MVKKDALYISEKAKDLFKKIDFADTYSTTNHKDDLKTIAYKIFDTSPAWVVKLMNLRNAIASKFGLDTEVPADAEQAYKVGGYIKFFQIMSIGNDELIMGADDSHLNFRAILSRTQDAEYNIKVTTIVEYNNSLGKIYMNIIKPGHKMILKVLVKNAFVDSGVLVKSSFV